MKHGNVNVGVYTNYELSLCCAMGLASGYSYSVYNENLVGTLPC